MNQEHAKAFENLSSEECATFATLAKARTDCNRAEREVERLGRDLERAEIHAAEMRAALKKAEDDFHHAFIDPETKS